MSQHDIGTDLRRSPQLQGLTTLHIDKDHSPIAKNELLGRKLKIFAQKRIHFLIETMFQPRPGKVVDRKSLPIRLKEFSSLLVS